ncbi:putative delta-60 repeat protein [Dokdonella fugitiva]|uniref:Putative delta-60 repeat protein n=1 Tax=Dokdonella fugitiva TaxID=328517 RepID=A0A839F5M7_9GAMM|nr:hypothetical protein [Dokdonella fugitiva]MBA8889886.1 putative delta-60 repeat protein [Dokdonella fugitiva]
MTHVRSRFTVVLSAFFATAALAHDGDLDPTFGTGGYTIIDFGATAIAYGLALAPDGKIVLGGTVDGGAATGTDVAVARLSRDGHPDTSFSFDGKTTVAVGAGAATDTSFNTIVQADGKIVTIGDGPDTAVNGDDSDMEVVRFNLDGSLDTSFSGDGKAFINIDAGGTNNDRALDGVQLANGKLILVGNAEVTGQGTDFAIVRLNADGSRDTSFDGDGRVTLHFDLDPTFKDEVASSVAIDASGNILVAGIAPHGSQSNYDFAIARLTPSGALDPNFGGDGRVTVAFDIGGNLDDEPLELSIGPDGSIYLTGAVTDNGYDFAALKLLPDGTPDPTFGNGGKVTVPFDLGDTNSDPAYGAALQADGKLVLVGFAAVAPGNSDIALARLTADGQLDPTFGFAGKQVIPLDLGGNLFDAAVRARIEDGYLVIGGVTTGAGGYTQFLAARIVIDTVFDDGFETTL